ncbi:uncharacterized protein LOC133789009 [Humulus lupulus]|uniref:uncharacterized protein LOC133789009 n=1 Tax=Humulus lupulus TaxID=3486 RepID=UPI002B409C5B|nr:uncharacterized protein LOC133789009 [Humulus lupulus]
MENFSYSSYPDSGDSSPHSREIDFENPPPWDDQPPQQHQNYKVKFMCSYGGKILPRPHDNQLCYIGGETKILAVDRTVKFSNMVSKLSALCENEVSFKYQLPGEDLDALISVTNDDDLEHMMHEYDRFYRTTGKPARMRLFLFPMVANSASSFGSEGPNPDRDQFVEALNLVQNHGSDPAQKPPVHNNVDFLFGLEKNVGIRAAASPPPPPTVPEPLAPAPEYQVMGGVNRVVGSNPPVNPVDIQRQLQKLQIEHEHQQQQLHHQQQQQNQQAMYGRKSDENLVGGYAGENYYIHKVPEKIPAMSAPPPQGYWPEKQVTSGGYPPNHGGAAQDHPVYMIPAHGAPVYHHQPMVRPVTGPPGQPQGYYQVQQQRMAPDVYQEQPVYNVVPPPQQQQHQPPLSAPPQNLPTQAPKMAATYQEGMGIGRPSGGGGGMVPTSDVGQYTQVAYDSATGRQVFYTAGGGMVLAPSQASAAAAPGPQLSYAAVAADTRPGGSLGQEPGKVVVTKVSQASV